MNVCRLCLSQENLVSALNYGSDFIQEIKNCVSIEISEHDNLSKTVCTLCIQKVKDWVSFKEICLKANETLLIESVRKKQSDKDTFILLEEDESESEDEKYFLQIFDRNIKLETKENIYTCDICSEDFNSCIEFLDHQPKHNGEPVFKCDKCPEVFLYRKDLVEHDKNHQTSCPKCGKMILKSSMKLHLVKHSEKYMCPKCSNCFNSRAILTQHVITVHTGRRDHICETCGKRFSSKTAMNVHLKSHSDSREYRCKLCDYAGRTASALYIHMSTHAKEVCVCEVCSKIFKSNRNLNDHLRRVHSKEKKHQCGYCDKKFVDKYMLTIHIRCHTGVRPYPCRFCNKAFVRSDGLKEHMATHGERVWHECDKCKRKFASKKGVTRHHCLGPPLS